MHTRKEHIIIYYYTYFSQPCLAKTTILIDFFIYFLYDSFHNQRRILLAHNSFRLFHSATIAKNDVWRIKMEVRMINPTLYRKRLIPDECILLEGDVIVRCDQDMIVTTWNTFRPKKEFDHGASVYYLKKGIKISKFLKSDNTLAYWYCDIVDYEYGKNTLPDCQPPEPASKAQQGHDCLTCIDLLADIVIYPDGFVKVVDLDELAEAAEQGLINEKTLHSVLLRVNDLLRTIYSGEFDALKAPLNEVLPNQ